MDSEQFKECAAAAADFIVNYYEKLNDCNVLPSVEPGYLQHLIPRDPPQQGEDWRTILRDVEEKIVPGLTHWQSPNFHAYFPTATSYPAMIGDLICNGLAVIGFSWQSSPACTELEVIVMDWLVKLLGLPEHFLHSSEGRGGGVIQSTASEATLLALLVAKEKKVRDLIDADPRLTDGAVKSKLVAYTSDQSNSSVEKAGIVGSMTMRLLPADEDGRLTAATLAEAIRKDKAAGLHPCYCVATIGSTGIASSDDVDALATVCEREQIWLHVDAAYAGAALSCPEYRYLLQGVDRVDSFNFNPHKWMLTTFDCSAFWVRDQKPLVEAMNVDRIYLQHAYQEIAPDYRHWQVPLGRKMRALKLFFVLRTYGVEGIRGYIRNHVDLCRYFVDLVRNDARFEVCTHNLGLATFRLVGDDALTEELLARVTKRKRIYVIPCHYRNKYVIRFAIGNRCTKRSEIDVSWHEIESQAEEVLKAAATAAAAATGDQIVGLKNEIAAMKIATNQENAKSTEKSK